MAQIPEAILRQLPAKKKAEGFDVEYRLKYSGTTETDKRTMTFVDNLWGIEVTGAVFLLCHFSQKNLSNDDEID